MVGRLPVPPGVLLLFALFAAAPLAVSGYGIRLLTLIFQWAAMAGAWNLLAGYTGVLDLGPVAPYGIGAFTVAILMARAGWGFFPSLAAAVAVAVGVAYALGRPTFRLKGAYFAVGTLAMAEALRELFLSWDRMTGMRLFGGSAGISLPLAPGPMFFYYTMLAIMAATIAAGYGLEVSRFGYGLKAIRDSEMVAEASGVDVPALKRRVYMLSAGFLSAVGGTAAYWLSYVNAADSLAPGLILQTIAVALIGGLGTPLGPLAGAVVLVTLQDVLGASFVYTYLIVLGAFITAVALFLPQGLVGVIRARRGGGRPATGHWPKMGHWPTEGHRSTKGHCPKKGHRSAEEGP